MGQVWKSMFHICGPALSRSPDSSTTTVHPLLVMLSSSFSGCGARLRFLGPWNGTTGPSRRLLLGYSEYTHLHSVHPGARPQGEGASRHCPAAIMRSNFALALALSPGLVWSCTEESTILLYGRGHGTRETMEI